MELEHLGGSSPWFQRITHMISLESYESAHEYYREEWEYVAEVYWYPCSLIVRATGSLDAFYRLWVELNNSKLKGADLASRIDSEFEKLVGALS